MKCILLDTPQSVMDEGNDFYDAGTDIFSEIMDDSGLVNREVMKQALWHAYRFRMIGGCDTAQWVQAMKDRAALVGPKWDAIITKAASTDLTDLHELAYTRELKRQAIEGTDGDVRTDSGEGADVSVTEDEDLPQTPIGPDERYLSRRSTTTNRPEATRTSTYAPNTKDTETYSEDRAIAARTFSDMMREYPHILIGWTNEFDGYFVQVMG